MSENANLAFENLDEEKKVSFFQSETFKTLITIAVILLIPVAAFAWNFFSGRDGLGQLKEALNITNTDDVKNDDQANSGATDDQNNNENNADSKVNGAKNSLPNTSSKRSYTVLKNDTKESISRKLCGDLSFYIESKIKESDIKVGNKITVVCAN